MRSGSSPVNIKNPCALLNKSKPKYALTKSKQIRIININFLDIFNLLNGPPVLLYLIICYVYVIILTMLAFRNVINFFITLSILLLILCISFFPQSILAYYIKQINLFVFLLFSLSIYNKRKLLFRATDFILLAFIITLFIEIAFAKFPDVAFEKFMTSYISIIPLYFLIRTQKTENYVLFLQTLSILSLFISLFCIFEFISGRNFIYEQFVKNQYYNDNFYAFRSFATLFHPTITGTYLVTSLPFSFLFILNDKKSLKYLGFAIFMSVIIGIFFTFSKMAWILALIFSYRLLKRVSKKYWILFSIILTLFILFYVSIQVCTKAQFLETHLRIIIIKPRLLSYLTGWHMILKHPFIGLGLGHFRILFNNYSNAFGVPDLLRIPDNNFLLILTETGIVGFILFSSFILTLIMKSRNTFNQSLFTIKKDLSYIIISSFTIILTHSISYDLFYWTTPLFLFWILAGMLANVSEDMIYS